jgi:CRP-like cAMP-binding protein
VHIVRRGRVELSRSVAGRRIVLQVLTAGDVFGDVPLLVRMTEPFDARALEDSVVLSADSVSLFRLLEGRPRLAQRWLVSLALRMSARLPRNRSLVSTEGST